VNIISVKGVLFNEGKVIIVKNDRDEWELPGGRLELNEQPTEAVCREFKEELNLNVKADELVDAYSFEVIPGRNVLIISYTLKLIGDFNPVVSAEHTEYGLFTIDEIKSLKIPIGYLGTIIKAAQQTNT
jgi:ADP-ribose pyrophosphatase YjhB (NUDIX family)